MPTLPQERSFSRTKASPVPAELRQQTLARVATMVELGNTAWAQLGKPPMPSPTVSFDLRGNAAGQAHMSRTPSGLTLRHLRINADLLVRETQEVITSVVPHEVAHLLAWHYFGHKVDPHGDEWSRVMRSLGQKPERLHSMKVEPARVEKRDFIYRCACKEHELTLRRHKKVLLGQAVYSCPSCGKNLRFISGPDVELPLQVSKPRAKPFLPSGRTPASKPPGGGGFFTVPGVPRPRPPAPPSPAGFPNGSPRGQQPAPLRSTGSPAASPAEGSHLDAPTQKQLTFARDLAVRKGVSLPPSALLNRKSLSEWIGRTSLLKERP